MAKYTREIDCSTNLRASLDEAGNFSLRARARMPYAPDAVVGAEVEVPEDLALAVRDAMDAALEAVREQLARSVDTNAAVALDAARRSGEVK